VIRFEYRTIGTPIVRAELDRLGLEGWQLAAIDGAVGWLMRDKDARLLKEQSDEHAAQRGAR
jgi:hypothetical protein